MGTVMFTRGSIRSASSRPTTFYDLSLCYSPPASRDLSCNMHFSALSKLLLVCMLLGGLTKQ